MAQMSLSDLQTAAKDFVANVSAARVTRAGNLALRKLYEVAGPTIRFTLTTTAPYSTGTVAITKGATAVTLSGGTFAASTEGQLIKAEGESTWYGFTYGSGSTGTLGSAFAGTTLTAGTFELAYAYYDLPTSLSSTFSLWRDSRSRLRRWNSEEMVRYMDSANTTAIPRAYSVVKGTHASNSAVRVLLMPFPDAVYTFSGVGRARPTLFPNSSPTTEYSGLPEEYDDALLAGTLFYLWDGEDKQDRSQWWYSMWKEFLKEAAATQMEGMDGQFGEAGWYGTRTWNADVAGP